MKLIYHVICPDSVPIFYCLISVPPSLMFYTVTERSPEGEIGKPDQKKERRRRRRNRRKRRRDRIVGR